MRKRGCFCSSALRNSYGVLPGGHRQLVHETFGHETVERVAHRAPVTHVDADFLLLEIHVHVGHVVGVVSRRLDRERVHHLFGDRGEHARGDRWPGQVQVPGDEIALFVECAGRLVECRRTIGVVSHVVFASPHELHGPLERLRYFDGRGDEIHLQAPAEAATEERGVELHDFGIESRGLRGGRMRDLRNLRGHVDVGTVGANVGGAVLRLERGVCEQRQLVVGADHFRRALDRRGHVTVIASHPAGPRRTFAQHLRDLRVGERAIRAGVPFDGERLARLSRSPPRVRGHRDARGREHHAHHARHRARLFVVERLHRTAERRRLRQRRIQHARQFHVDAEDAAAIHLGRRVLAPLWLADHREIAPPV